MGQNLGWGNGGTSHVSRASNTGNVQETGFQLPTWLLRCCVPLVKLSCIKYVYKYPIHFAGS